MPTIGGVTIGYDVTTPADTENAGQGDDRIRSLKTSLQQAMDAEHNFPAGGGANTGYHALGSARPYVGTQSAVSSSGSDGRLMYTSDSSRLFGVGSEGTVLLGDTNLLSVGTTAGISRPQRAYWALEFGQAVSDADGRFNITYPSSGFSGRPYFTATAFSVDPAGPYFVSMDSAGMTASTVSGLVRNASSTVAIAAIPFQWMSIGTRTL